MKNLSMEKGSLKIELSNDLEKLSRQLFALENQLKYDESEQDIKIHTWTIESIKAKIAEIDK